MPWARVSITGWASRGVWNTALVMRTASGSCAAMASARAWAASSSVAGSTSSVMSPTREAVLALEDLAGEQDLLGQGLADEFLQPPGGTGRGHDAEPGLRVAHPQRRGADAEVRRVGQLGAAAEGEAVQCRDDRHRQLGDPVEDAGVDAGQGIVPAALAQLGDVGAGREDGLGTGLRVGGGAGEDQDLRGALKVRAHGVQLVDHRLVDGVPAPAGRCSRTAKRSSRSSTSRVTKPAASSRVRRRTLPLHQMPSSSRAVPWPTPTHMVARPSLRPLRGFAFQAAEQGDDEAGPGGAERVAEGDRAAVVVHDFRVRASVRAWTASDWEAKASFSSTAARSPTASRSGPGPCGWPGPGRCP